MALYKKGPNQGLLYSPQVGIAKGADCCCESVGACCHFKKMTFPPACCPSHATGEQWVAFGCEDDVEGTVCNQLNVDRDNGNVELNDYLNVFHNQQTCEDVNNCEAILAAGCIPTSFSVLVGQIYGEYTNYPCNAGQMGGTTPFFVETTPSKYPLTLGQPGNTVTYQTSSEYIQAIISQYTSQSFSVPGLWKTYTMSEVYKMGSGDCFASIDMCDASVPGWADHAEVDDGNGGFCCETTTITNFSFGFCDTPVGNYCGCENQGSNGALGSWNVIITPDCAGCYGCGGVSGWAYAGTCNVTSPVCGIKCNPNFDIAWLDTCVTCGHNQVYNYYAQGIDKGYWKSCCASYTVSGC